LIRVAFNGPGGNRGPLLFWHIIIDRDSEVLFATILFAVKAQFIEQPCKISSFLAKSNFCRAFGTPRRLAVWPKRGDNIYFMSLRAATPEIIICAAVRASNGKIVRGHRHNDANRALQAMPGYEGENPNGDDQGFVTSTNRFVNRKEAYRLHFPDLTEPGELHSDDLY
jgi:hypothetical protein